MWAVACGGMSLPGGTGCCYHVRHCLCWGVVTRSDVACGGVSLLGGTLLVVRCYQIGHFLWWGVITRWDRVSLPGGTLLVVGCHYQVGQGVVTR